MKQRRLFKAGILLGIMWMVSGRDIFPQSNNLEWECGCTPDTVLSTELGNSITYENTSLRVGILLVQFADWQTNWNARGGVGYDTSDISIANIIYNKYRWSHIWNMYYSVGVYKDIDPTDPQIHPDAHSHQIAVYGSFTDYWWEVSHKNLRIDAAETHPSYDGHFRSGIVNNVDTSTGIIQWVTLDHTVSYYVDTLGRNAWALIADAHAKAHELYADPNVPDSLKLDRDVENSAHFDKIIIVYAGIVKGPGTVDGLGGRYAICNEVDPRRGGWPLVETPGMAGISCKAHEFGHLLYFDDLHAMGIPGTNGVGYFSHMGRGSAWDRPRLGTLPRRIWISAGFILSLRVSRGSATYDQPQTSIIP